MIARCLVGSIVVAVVLAVVQAASARETKTTRTLLTTKTTIRAFAQDSSRIAWIGRKWHVDVRGTGHRPKTVLVGSAHPFVGGSGGVPSRLALVGSRAFWTRHGGGNDFETSVWTRKVVARGSARMVFLTAADREDRSGSYFGGLAAGSSTVAFTTVDYQCLDPDTCSQLTVEPTVLTGTYRVTGTASRVQVPNAPGSVDLAVGAGRVALLPAPGQIAPSQVGEVTAPSLAEPGTTVEIRDAVTGALSAQFTPPGTVRALALSGAVAAVVDRLGDGTTAIERYDPTTGTLLGATIDVAAGDSLSVSGHTLVYAVGNTIEAMDATTGTQRVLAASPGPPIGLSVAGKRVAWAVNAHGRGRVLALTLP
jgi:hypothetical protein